LPRGLVYIYQEAKIYTKAVENNQALIMIMIMAMKPPGYQRLLESGELLSRSEQLRHLFAPCRLCPWQCGVDRPGGERGQCGAGRVVRVAKAMPHFGEEPAISGSCGSGTIFFAHCNLRCCFCQNYQISQQALGVQVSTAELAEMMLRLQAQGCHNINLVSSAHYLPLVVEALCQAAAKGLSIPIVYNSNGYEGLHTLRLLDGIIDIYLPDVKYAQDAPAQTYSAARDYPRINLAAVQEMFAQVGHLTTDGQGLALKGLLVRHLVLPHGLAGTSVTLQRLKELFGPQLFISLMAQYMPCYHAHEFEELRSRITRTEYAEAVDLLEALGLENGWVQDWDSLDASFFPDFSKSDTWN
jgi:putative pyruvate formate lyase activating enzyme